MYIYIHAQCIVYISYNICMHVFVCVHGKYVYMAMYINIYVHIGYIHAYIHTYILTCMCVFSGGSSVPALSRSGSVMEWFQGKAFWSLVVSCE